MIGVKWFTGVENSVLESALASTYISGVAPAPLGTGCQRARSESVLCTEGIHFKELVVIPNDHTTGSGDRRVVLDTEVHVEDMDIQSTLAPK
jgi:hypothetical protein